ncbi:hypothetical protein CDL12_12560 [Handroanthus impetiginosus]|uniref:Bet v I/Major latex protein domain-containing protein n=1 Tax=Handroanthus impetiginosus TaxID=429701 RepID=A0A2G9HBX9_9LAMI|nr:hypothetical protein CDL12_12560 [Handroanthus impetiginosus]
MTQIAKTEAKAEIKSSPVKVFDFLKYNLNQFLHMFPQAFKKVELLEGEEGQAGNVRLLEYALGNEPMTAKVKTEAINEDEKSITFIPIEGEIMRIYTTFVAKVTVGDGYVMWSIEYEKANDSVPNPDSYAKLAAQITKGLDAYLCTQI